ncbi:MAG: DUF302 domain-containing protein, partial [Thiobacillaceae bacterium]|nr:DUF302 domain-containing protein [Thiobacillaceae bacterium]
AQAPLGRLIRQALYGGAALGLAMSLGLQPALAGKDDNQGNAYAYGNDGFDTVTPFNRIAKLPVVRDKYGEVDHVATYAKVKAAALALANFVALYKDSAVLGGDVIKGDDWVLGGTSLACRKTQTCTAEEIKKAIIEIPSPEPIDPNDPTYLATGVVTAANTKKASVLDFCNEHFAKQALGVAPIVGDRKVVNGYSHTPALPCEVSIWNDEDHIYVDMLDPNAIFSLFFTDVLFSADMQDPAFAEAIGALPPQVKAEIQAVVLHAMNEFDAKTKVVDKPMGPKYKGMNQVVDVVAASPYQSPYLHMGYTKVGGAPFTAADSTAVTQAIINTMSIHGTPTEGQHPTAIDGGTLDNLLSPGSSWRSARPVPLTLPGNNHVIEACSPKYAKMAMGAGLEYVTALPCEITVQIIDQDGNGSTETLVVSYLDPHFMLNALFADVPKAMQTAFAPIPGLIMTDLQNIVRAALQNSGLNEGVRISYDMLP